MSQLDIVLLFVYLICTAYSLVKIFNSFNDVYSVQAVKDKPRPLNDQLRDQNFPEDLVDVSFSYENRYEYKELVRIPINIANKSADHSIYVQWDKSSLTDFLGRSRRVVRVPSSLTLDLLQNQAPSVIAPGKTLKEKLTAEDAFEREADGVKIKENPVIDFLKLKGGSKPEKKLFTDFDDFKRTLLLDLKLSILFFDPDVGGTNYRPCYLEFTFSFEKLPWYAGLPWNPKR